MDGAAGQDFFASSVPSMDQLTRDVAKQVPWPGTSGTAYDNWAKSAATSVPTPDRLGSGSDYTAFLDHFGVPAADLGSSTGSGDYHCSCDNFYTESHFIDPGWRYHVSTAQVVGLAVLRLADADVVPLHDTPYAAEVGACLNELSGQQNDVFGHEVVNLDRDKAQAAAWAAAATALEHQIDQALDNNASGTVLNGFTRRLERVERELLVARGLPGRAWFKHQIYAPGVNSGYGTQVLPGINDALFLRNDVAQAKAYAASLFARLRRATRS